MRSTSKRDGFRLAAGSSRNGYRGIPPVGLPARKECRTCERMSSITLTTLVLPDALAPNTPATGSTPMGRPPSRQVTRRTASSSASLVEISDNSNSSRNDRTFSARKASSADAPQTALVGFIERLLQETFADASLISQIGSAHDLRL